MARSIALSSILMILLVLVSRASEVTCRLELAGVMDQAAVARAVYNRERYVRADDESDLSPPLARLLPLRTPLRIADSIISEIAWWPPPRASSAGVPRLPRPHGFEWPSSGAPSSTRVVAIWSRPQYAA